MDAICFAFSRYRKLGTPVCKTLVAFLKAELISFQKKKKNLMIFWCYSTNFLFSLGRHMYWLDKQLCKQSGSLTSVPIYVTQSFLKEIHLCIVIRKFRVYFLTTYSHGNVCFSLHKHELPSWVSSEVTLFSAFLSQTVANWH